MNRKTFIVISIGAIVARALPDKANFPMTVIRGGKTWKRDGNPHHPNGEPRPFAFYLTTGDDDYFAVMFGDGEFSVYNYRSNQWNSIT